VLADKWFGQFPVWGKAGRKTARVAAANRVARLAAVLLALLAGTPPACAQSNAVTVLQQAADTAFQPVGRATNEIGENSPRMFAQDASGRIWAANDGSIFHWDGYAAVAYDGDDRPDGLADHSINALHKDAAGVIWVGSMTGGLARYDGVSDRFVAVPLELRSGSGAPEGSDEVRDIADDGMGGILVATADGLFHRDASGRIVGHEVHSAKDETSLPDDRLRAVLRDRAGRVWVGGALGLSVAPDTASARFSPVKLADQGEPEPLVSRLLEDQSGNIWIGTHDGAWVLPRAGNTPLRIAMPGAALAAHEVMAMTEAAADEVWIGTYGEGIVVAHADGSVRHIVHYDDVPKGLESNVIFGLFRDTAGLVWVSTPFGVSRAQLSPGGAVLTYFDHPNARLGMTVEQPTSLLMRRDGGLWIGSEADGIEVIDPQGHVAGHVPVQPVVALAEAPDGRVFAGGRGGAYVIDRYGRQAVRLHIPGRGDTDTLWALAMVGDTLWLGGDTDGAWVLKVPPDRPAQVIRHINPPGLGNKVLCIQLLPDGTVGVATLGGLWLASQDGTLRGVFHADPSDPFSLPSNKVDDIAIDSRGRVWVATWDGRAAVATSWPAQGKPRFLRLPITAVGNIMADLHGQMWATIDGGLAAIDEKTLDVQFLRQADGISTSSFWEGSKARSPDGTLLFGGVGSFVIVRPDRLKAGHFTPQVAVSRLLIGGKPVESFNGTDVVLAPGQRSFSVDFAALDYADPATNRYRYRLDGFDQDWVATDSAHRVAAYTNLGPGNYTLWLGGSDHTGAWSPRQVRLSVHVLPAWYETLTFRVALGFVVLGAFWALLHIRTRLLRGQQHALERQVAERTAELRESQSRLERLAYIDPLTALPNRRAFNNHVRSSCSGRRGSFALAIVDLDGFKPVNDTLGHDAGDALLTLTAARLRDAVRTTDFVARLGGDEFAIMLADIQEVRTAEFACDRIIAAMSEATMIQERPVRVGASVGIALYPRHGETVEALYKSADLALYEAKRSGRGTWRWFKENLAQAS
jgi:diguanylate cyclase (GGDEF)-like protein